MSETLSNTPEDPVAELANNPAIREYLDQVITSGQFDVWDLMGLGSLLHSRFGLDADQVTQLINLHFDQIEAGMNG